MNGLVVDAAACLTCSGELVRDREALACVACGRYYASTNGVPVLASDLRDDPAKSGQASYFDELAGTDWEIVRPRGAPRLHSWLLEEKFRRATTAPGLSLRNATALVVCGGSGFDAELLARAGATVVTSDLSFGSASRAAERSSRFSIPFESVVADAEKLPFRDQSIDFVYVHDGLHHLERPADALAEMARVARVAVGVSEPARAVLTAVAVRAGIATNTEESGNRVARLDLEEVASVLRACSFRVVHAERYGMYYRHEPTAVSRLLSAPGLFALSKAAFRFANAIGGRFGNKLVVTAVRG